MKAPIAMYQYWLMEEINEQFICYYFCHTSLLGPCGAYRKMQFEKDFLGSRRGWLPLRPLWCI
jgi:hypothetical protein